MDFMDHLSSKICLKINTEEYKDSSTSLPFWYLFFIYNGFHMNRMNQRVRSQRKMKLLGRKKTKESPKMMWSPAGSNWKANRKYILEKREAPSQNHADYHTVKKKIPNFLGGGKIKNHSGIQSHGGMTATHPSVQCEPQLSRHRLCATKTLWPDLGHDWFRDQEHSCEEHSPQGSPSEASQNPTNRPAGKDDAQDS